MIFTGDGEWKTFPPGVDISIVLFQRLRDFRQVSKSVCKGGIGDYKFSLYTDQIKADIKISIFSRKYDYLS
jgi:hypothetical protein